jgi:hypothetical protein
LFEAEGAAMSYGRAANQQWEETQTKAFTNWLNHVLSKRGIKITNAETELSDGIAFVALLEELSGKVG